MYTWGWKECVPSVRVIRDFAAGGGLQKDTAGKNNMSYAEEGRML